jgi:branched-chain amino acid transport system substrate-binding protein
MRKTKSLLIIGLIASVVFLATCATAAPASEKILKIGCTAPLSESFGVDVKQALEISVDLVNQRGGINIAGEKYKIQLIIYDDKYQADLGRAGVERLIEVDEVKAIVGTVASPAAYGCLPVIQAKGIPLFTAAWTTKLLDPKFKYVYTTTTARSADCLYNLILKKLEPQIKTVVLASVDNETGHSIQETSIKWLTYYGIKILDNFFYPYGTKDYNPIITRMAAKNPDFFAMPGSGNSAVDTGLAQNAIAISGWHGPRFYSASPVIKELVEICSKGQAEGVYFPLTDFTEMPNPPQLALDLRKVFEKRYNKWREVGAYWTLPFWFYVAAVEKAGSIDADKIDKAMANLGVIKTPVGEASTIKRPDLKINKNIDVMNAPILSKVKDNRAAFVAQMSVSEAIEQYENVIGFKGQWK